MAEKSLHKIFHIYVLFWKNLFHGNKFLKLENEKRENIWLHCITWLGDRKIYILKICTSFYVLSIKYFIISTARVYLE